MEDDLKTLRIGSGKSQAAFAHAMGMPLRTYENLESGSTAVRPVHICAAYWALIRLAAESDLKIDFLPLNVAAIVREAAKEKGA